MSQISDYNPEFLSGVSEEVEATAKEMRELTTALYLVEGIQEAPQPVVEQAKKPFETHPEPTPIIPLQRAGMPADAVSQLTQRVHDIHDGKIAA